jgi:WD40 repeat protein
MANAFLFILDASAGEIIATLPPTGAQTTVQCMQFSHDGKILAYGLTTGQLVVWDITADSIESEIPQPPAEADWWPHCSAFSPDDRLIAANYGTSTKIWERATKTFIAQIDEPQWPYLLFSQDGKTLLVETPPVTTYSTDTWQKLSSIWGEDGFYPYWAVADVSPDLTLYADAEIDINRELTNGPVRVYDLKTGDLLQTLEGAWNSAGWVLFTPDGRYLLRIDDTGRGLAVWEVDGWKYSDESSVLASKISPDEHFIRRLIFSSDGRSIFVWTYARLALYGLP